MSADLILKKKKKRVRLHFDISVDEDTEISVSRMTSLKLYSMYTDILILPFFFVFSICQNNICLKDNHKICLLIYNLAVLYENISNIAYSMQFSKRTLMSYVGNEGPDQSVLRI